MIKEQVIRSYYSAWQKKQWSTIESVLADGFTFTSPNDDDHIDKYAFKAKCWSEADGIVRVELETIIGGEADAFVRYLSRTKRGTSFRNVEYFRFTGEKISAIEVYFGGDVVHPS